MSFTNKHNTDKDLDGKVFQENWAKQNGWECIDVWQLPEDEAMELDRKGVDNLMKKDGKDYLTDRKNSRHLYLTKQHNDLITITIRQPFRLECITERLFVCDTFKDRNEMLYFGTVQGYMKKFLKPGGFERLKNLLAPFNNKTWMQIKNEGLIDPKYAPKGYNSFEGMICSMKDTINARTSEILNSDSYCGYSNKRKDLFITTYKDYRNFKNGG